LTITAATRAFVNAQRQALEQLESFADTPDFDRLLATLQPYTDGGEHSAWLAGWLIEPDEDLAGERPVDVAVKPGGVELLIDRLERMAGGLCA